MNAMPDTISNPDGAPGMVAQGKASGASPQLFCLFPLSPAPTNGM